MGIRKYLGEKLKWAGEIVSGPGRFYSLTDPALSKSLRGFGNMNPRLISLRNPVEILKAWEQCPPIVSIVCGKALADITGRITFKYIGTDEEVNISKQLTARAMMKLLQRPNPMQTWRQFRAQQKIYTQLFGFCPVLCVKPVGFTDVTSVKMMWNLPPQYLVIKTTGKLFYQTDASGIIESIEINYNGVVSALPVSDIFILKDQYASLYQEAIPSSRISALQYPISNIVSAYTGANVLITKHGALGILSNASKDAAGGMPVRPDEKVELQKDLQNYGLNEEQWQVIITTAALSWQQIALPIKDLMLYEAIEDGTRQCCAVFNYPYGLLPKAKNDSFHNKGEDKKSLYQDAIMPEAESDMEVYNDYFKLAEKGIALSLDYGHLEVFQLSASDKATALKAEAQAAQIMYANNIITLNRMREMMGEDTVAGDDKYFKDLQPTLADPNTDPNNQNVNNEPVTA